MKARIFLLGVLLVNSLGFYAQSVPYPNNINGGASNGIVGKIADDFSVNPNGLVNYNIPINVPPGSGGMTPQLSLTYNSTQSTGLLGSGFELTGLSVINRAPANKHIDGGLEGKGYVDFSNSDKFMLDGQRLILISSTYNATSWEYRTENNSFSQIIATGGTQGSPEKFTVKTKSGLVYHYENNTAPLTRSASAANTSLFWLLTKVSDTKGNYFTVSYSKDDTNGEYWPTRIDYTGNTNTGLAPYNSIRLDYGTHQYYEDAFVYGIKIRKSRILLGINIYSGTKRVKYYTLSYQTVNNKKQLASVTEYAADGSKLNPTVFTWHNSTNYKTTNVNYNTTSYINKANLHVGDFNGDGKADFLVTPKPGANWSGWRLFISNGSSFSYHSSGSLPTGEIQEIAVGDFNGDGYADFVVKRKYNNQWYNSELFLAKVTGTSVTFQQIKNVLSDQRNYSIRTAEFNGDGASDLFIYFHNSRECKLIRSEYYSGTFTPLSYTATRYCATNFDRVEMVDFDGNGLTDAMNLHSSGYNIMICDGAGTMTASKSGTWPDKDHHLYFGDFNGDGKTDMLVTGWNRNPNSGGWSEWQVRLSKGDYTFETNYFSPKFNSKNKRIYVADINGDGKDDFFAVDYAAPTNMLSPVYAYINNNTGRNFTQVSGASTYGLDKWNFYLGDFNGDGKTDFLCTANFSNVNWTGCQLYLVPSGVDNLIASITDGLGVVTEIEYKPMSDRTIHTRGSNSNYPLTSFANSWYLVDKVNKTNGIGGKNATTFRYNNALIHRAGRGVVGFETFTQKDLASQTEVITRFEVDNTHYVSAVKSVETKINGVTVNMVENTNTIKTYNSSYYRKIFTYLPMYTKERKYEYNSRSLLSTTENTYEYDDYGNVTKHTNKIGSNTITTTNVYTNDVTNWYLGRLTKSVVNKKGSNDDITLTSTYEYYSDSGLLKSESFEPGDNKLGYTKTYIHDDYGNIKESKITPNNSTQTPKTTKTVYDTRGRFVKASYDYMNYYTSYIVDNDLGVITSATDPNNYTTSYQYNKFGNLILTQTPMGYKQEVYRWANGHSDAPGTAVYFKYSEVKGMAPILEFFDRLDRKVRSVTIGFDSRKIYVDAIYNDKGQLVKNSEPYLAGQSIYWNINHYDPVGRLSKQVYADNTEYNFQYNGFRTTTTDPLGQTTTKTYDVYGNLIESIDAASGRVNYEYDVSQNCKRIISPRTTIINTYNKVGKLTKQQDPDIGTTSLDYNAYGEVISKTINGKVINYTYDAKGRIKEENSADGKIVYHYDTRWKGEVDKITKGSSISEEYFYDVHGRMIKKQEITDGKSFITETSYNSNNNLIETILYPSGLKIKNEYDGNGYLKYVKNNNTNHAYWTANKRNARGQLESIKYGNNLTTNINYHPQKGYITNIITGNIQNWSYQFNSVGNLTSRRDNLKSLLEEFEYDALNRLTKVNHNGRLQQEIRYDAAGNITYKTDIGTEFEYKSGSNRLLSIKGGSYMPKEWDVVNYNVHNKVSYIKSGNNSQTIVYGVRHKRKKTVTVINGITETKYYSGNLYEEVIKNGETKQINYIFAGGQSVAIFEKSNISGEKVQYLHKDHLGSLQVISDQSGNRVQELSYDAWGRRRNPANWQYYPNIANANALTPRGFTGHEHLDIFEIVNMDGRMYDPVIGRFLSPDPFVQAPDYTQSFNRYAYCLNNPLSLYDPSGYSWFSKNWKSLLSATVGIAVTIISGGIGSGIGGVMIAGALGGASAGLTGALLNGANLGQVAKSVFTGGFWGTIGGFLANASGGGHFLERLFKHTFSQAWLEGVKGGNMMHGFMSGAASVVGGYGVGKFGSKLSYTGKVIANSIVSGTATELGGGKFANGAITGAFSMMFNDMMHEIVEDKDLRKYVDDNFPGRIPEGVKVKFIFCMGVDGLCTPNYPLNTEFTIEIPEHYFYMADKSYLYDVVDHELVHLDDFVSGVYQKYREEYSAKDALNILDYRAYTKNYEYNANNPKRAKAYKDRLEELKKVIPEKYFDENK